KRTKLLVALLPYLNETERDRIAQQAIELVGTIRFDFYRSELVVGMAPFLRDRSLLEATDLIHEITNEVAQARALGAINHLIDDPTYSSISRKIIESIRATDPWVTSLWKEKVEGVAPYLRASDLQEVFELVKSIRDKGDKIQALDSLAPYLDTKI